MKKNVLLTLTVPAMLLAASCGTKIDHKALLVKDSNADDVLVNIACNHCLVKQQGSAHDPSEAISKRYAKKFHPVFDLSIDTDVKTKDMYKLPQSGEDIIFKIDGQDKTDFTYKYISDQSATLEFDIPDQEINSIVASIDATTACVQFTLALDNAAEVGFNYNGALDHVVWDINDPSKTTNTKTSHEYTASGSYTVSIYGDVSSVWFTNREKDPESNSSLLKGGNDYITQISFNHTIESIPSYACNGIHRLEKVYIGDNVISVGKKAFKMNAPSEINPRTIYTANLSKPEGWDDEWTDCPICYGISSAEAFSDGHISILDGKPWVYKIVQTTSGTAAVLIRYKGNLADFSDGLTLPVQVQEAGQKELPVCGIAPFAFYNSGILNIAPTISIDNVEEGTNPFVEFGDYSFATMDSGGKVSLDLSNITGGTRFRIGCNAFYHANITTVKFPAFKDSKGSELIIDKNAFAEVYGERELSILLSSKSFEKVIVNDGAFNNAKLSSITDGDGKFPESITTIGDMAFANNSQLKIENFLITENVESIGEKAFLNDHGVKSALVKYEERPEKWSVDWNVLDNKGGERIDVQWGFVKDIDDSEGTHFIYRVFKKSGVQTATILGYSDKTATSIEIPETLTDPIDTKTKYNVTGIASGAFVAASGTGDFKDLISVFVPASVTKVGESAFRNCNPLLKVFYRGSDISGWDEQWTMPGEGLDVGAALYINYSGTVSAGDLDNSRFDIVKENNPENGEYNAAILKYNAPEATEKVTIPATVTDATKENTYNITSIGGKAFAVDPAEPKPGSGIDLSQLEFADDSTISSLGAEAFGGAKMPTTMALPKSIKDMGTGVFALTGGVKLFDLSSTQIKSVLPFSFTYSTVAEIKLPEEVELKEGAFLGAINLSSVVNLAKTKMEGVPNSLFSGCSNYSQIAGVFPQGISTIGNSAFEDSGVTSADLTEYTKLIGIGRSAFSGTNLETIKTPSSLTSLGNNALYGCPNLSTIDLSAFDGAVMPDDYLFGNPEVDLPAAFKKGGNGKIIVRKGQLKKSIDSWYNLFKLAGMLQADYEGFFQEAE